MQAPLTTAQRKAQLHLFTCVDSIFSPRPLTKTEQKTDWTARDCLSVFLKGVVGAFAISSKIPYIKINLQLPFPSGLKEFCAGSNFVSWLILECDLGFQIIDNVLHTPSEPEKALQIQKSTASKVGLYFMQFFSAPLAIGSQIPTVFQAIKYNSPKWREWIAASVGGAGVIFPLRSLLLSCEKMSDQQHATSNHLELRKNLLNIIKANQSAFEQMPWDQKAVFSKELETIKSFEIFSKNFQRELIVKKFLSILSDPSQSLEKKPTSFTSVAALVAGLVLTGSYELFNAMYAYSGTEENLGYGKPAAFSMAALFVVSTCYLTAQSNIALMKKVFTSTVNRLTCQPKPTLIKQFRPKVEYLYWFSTFISLCSSAAYWKIVKDYFDGNPALFKDSPKTNLFFQLTTPLPVFFILQTSANRLIENYMKSSIAAGSSKKPKDLLERKLIEIDKQFEQLIDLVKKIDPAHLPLFIPLLPDSVQRAVGLASRETELDFLEEGQSERDKQSSTLTMIDPEQDTKVNEEESPFDDPFDPSNRERKSSEELELAELGSQSKEDEEEKKFLHHFRDSSPLEED